MYYCHYYCSLELLSGLSIDRLDKINVGFAPHKSIHVKTVVV